MMQSSSSPREYELVDSSRSSGDVNEHHPSSLQHDEADAIIDGVWSVYSVPKNRPRRKKIIGLVVVCALVVLVVIVVSSRRGGDSAVPASSTGTSSSQPDTTFWMPPSPPTVASTTAPPTAVRTTPSPTAAPSPTYNCEGDRIQNGVHLKTNHYICDHYKRYRFGMNEHGSLLYADDETNKTVIINQGHAGFYFELLEDGRFTVCNSTESIQWELECSDDVSFSTACLPTHHKVYDCPYLHLHSGGTIVLNWIADDGEWKERNILHMYDLPKCHDHFFCE